MKMITALIEVSSGAILLDNQPIHTDLIAYKHRTGYVPEQPHLYTNLNARDGRSPNPHALPHAIGYRSFRKMPNLVRNSL
jgi:ABC-type proline/glycine betaine transport system ATPase subunit